MSIKKGFCVKHMEILLYCAVFLAMFIFCSLTPLLTDDYTLSFNLATGERISSLSDLVESISYLRNSINGRAMAHTIVQLVLLLPKPVFNILNALNCVLLLFLSKKFFAGKSKSESVFALFVQVLLIWNFMPAFGNVFLWLDGAINYTWGIGIMLLYLWPFAAEYFGEGKKIGAVKTALYIVIAFVAGAYSENGSIAIIFMAACFVLLLLEQKRRVPLLLILCLAASVVGFVFLMTAPAESAGRMAELSISALADNLKTVLLATKERLLILYCLYAVLLVIGWKRIDRRRLIASMVLVVGGIGSLAAFIFASYFISRHFCFTAFFQILACVMLIVPEEKENGKLFYRCMAAVLTVLFVFNAFIAAIDIVGTFVNYRERLATIEQAKTKGETGLTLPPLLGSSEYSAAMRYDLSVDPNAWPNVDFARYHGLDWVAGDLPE